MFVEHSDNQVRVPYYQQQTQGKMKNRKEWIKKKKETNWTKSPHSNILTLNFHKDKKSVPIQCFSLWSGTLDL